MIYILVYICELVTCCFENRDGIAHELALMYLRAWDSPGELAPLEAK